MSPISPRLIDAAEYVACLPPAWQARAQAWPESDWWQWRDMSVHIARVRNPAAKARLLILHGAGGHAGALWPAAALAASLGFEVLVPDLPGYGQTRVPDSGRVCYPDWVDCVSDLVRAENQAAAARGQATPLVVLGASMGGLLGYAVAARTGEVAQLLATCLLDPSNPVCWPALSRWGGAVSVRLLRPLMKPLAGAHAGALARLRVPIRWIAPMHTIANQPALTRLCLEDARGGGGRVPLGFLASFLHSQPEVPPEQFRTTPVTLVHPAADRWTPPAMSLAFFDRIAAPKRYVALTNCGHFPVEEPGMGELAGVLEGVYQGCG
jgi:alpha-beta hydrolase superfamily lysophospholipase